MDNFDGGLDEIQDRFDLKIPPHPQLFAFALFWGTYFVFEYFSDKNSLPLQLVHREG